MRIERMSEADDANACMHVLAIVKRDDADGNASAFLSHAAASNSLDVSGWEAATCRRRLGAPMFSPTQPRQSKVSVSADSSNYHIIWIDLKPLGQINTRQRRHVTLQRKTQRSTDACACRDRQKCTREDEFMYGCAVGRVVFLDGCGNGFHSVFSAQVGASQDCNRRVLCLARRASRAHRQSYQPCARMAMRRIGTRNVSSDPIAEAPPDAARLRCGV